MKKLIFLTSISLVLVFAACQGDQGSGTNTQTPKSTKSSKAPKPEKASYDPNRGEGKFDATNVDVSGFDAAMAARGKSIADTKCMSCHKATEERLVGPGWLGVTERRTPHWLLNFITNPDPMIDKDPELQAQLEICLVRMPNQNVAEQEARELLEYMREIDGAN